MTAQRPQAESVFAAASRGLSFFTGLGIMVWQTVVEQADRPYLIAAALVMMGVPVAGIVTQSLGGGK